ncbi:hypothetical protein J5N97_009744 [Dioscorea zingiberensis]|uniref:Vps53 N-terminal domain-containing protein n=1 Tax=Dioscorea zingiberensis TaxID=325984 RepID=A0A9D5CYX6_9LILI|nr:hypothetical protein J5N97_009744 [Dioscorea zingiberensis]
MVFRLKKTGIIDAITLVSIPIRQVLETRPDICLVAEFPQEGRRINSFDKEVVMFAVGVTLPRIPSLILLINKKRPSVREEAMKNFCNKELISYQQIFEGAELAKLDKTERRKYRRYFLVLGMLTICCVSSSVS